MSSAFADLAAQAELGQGGDHLADVIDAQAVLRDQVAQLALVEAYAKTQGMWHNPDKEPVFSEYMELDLSTVQPSMAGPKRPEGRVDLSAVKAGFAAAHPDMVKPAQ